MKILLLAAVLFLGTGALAAPAPPSPKNQVLLTKEGRAFCAIHVPPEVMAPDVKPEGGASSAQTVMENERRKLRESVNDLAYYLKKISGVEIPIIQSPPAGNTQGTPILIGGYALRKFGAPVKLSPYKQGFRVVVSKQGVGLLGQNDESTSYAIYEILDRLGCRWFMPTEMGESLPSLKTVSLEAGDVSVIPSTAYRNVWFGDAAFKRRNRLGGFAIEASHALEYYVTQEQRNQHPEWRAIIGGQPSALRLKWSNPEVSSAVADAIIAKLDARYEPCISISPEDGSAFDESDDTKWDAGDWDTSMNQVSITDRYVRFCNLVVDRVTKKYPDVRFGFLAYVQYTRPPVREKLHPNLVPMIAPITYCRAHAMTDTHICPSRPQIRAIVEGWGKAAKQVSYYNYMYNLAEVSVPYPMMHQMKQELPILYANKVTFWQPETANNFEEVLPGMWLTLRKSWNAAADSDAILDEFFKRFYGQAEEPMRLYWTLFDGAWAGSSEHAGMDASYVRRFPPAFMRKARNAMDAALRLARDPVLRQRVEMQDEALKQFERLMQMKWDINAGRLDNLEAQSNLWFETQTKLGEKYEPQSAFTKVGWAGENQTMAGAYYKTLFGQHFAPAGRIARDYAVISKPLREWSYQQDADKKGQEKGWQREDFADGAWKKTDLGVDNWMTLGLASYYGSLWYRTTLSLPEVPAGKKVYLWVPSEDGDIRLFVNGRDVPYIDEKGAVLPQFSGGFGKPVSFDITSAVKPNAINKIAIVGTRTFLNELGTGGLMAPVFIYRDK